MGRLLYFFIIGLVVSGFGLYQYQKDRTLRQEIDGLKQELSAQSASLDVRAEYEASKAYTEQQSKQFQLPQVDQKEIYSSRQNAITRAISRTSDAVVGINVVQLKEVRNPLIPQDPVFRMLYDEKLWPRTVKRKVENLGSGFLISPDGLVVTNEHVVRDAQEVVVTLTTGQKYDAKVVGTDPLSDMALLRIAGTDLPYIRWADSDKSIVGEWAIAIGNPYGLFDVNDQPSVSVGVISALHRDFERDSDGRIYSDMIQTDAAINRGNSGGPLLNANGEALGMNTLIFTESGGSVGIGFAIPAARIISAIDDLLKGGVNRSYWIGIRAADLTGIMHRVHGLQNNEGAVVTGIETGSPAEKAGIKFEDVILEINGESVDCAYSAKKILGNTDLRVGDTLKMKLSRKGRSFEVQLTLAPLPNQIAG